MKTFLVFCISLLLFVFCANAQLTQINSNNSLHEIFPVSNAKTILFSTIDSTLWVTDATQSGTVQLSAIIKYDNFFTPLSGKVVFRGSSSATGTELFITDGTPGGTVLLKDIYSGTTSSAPSELLLMSNAVYFTAATAAEGRELWKTDGTPGGTSLVKDIVTGPVSSNTENNFHLATNGSYLLFAASTTANGNELWKSDGTGGGTALLKDINTGSGGTASSNPWQFYTFNNLMFFAATDATHSEEIWKTDGTPGGTDILKDINPTGNSTSYELFPGVDIRVFRGFHNFNGRIYFNASDGTGAGQVWSSDGSTVNTTLLKDITPGAIFPSVSVISSINLPGKFFFTVSDGSTTSELWVSDGTPAGTDVFKSFSPTTPGEPPIIFIPYDFDPVNGTGGQHLFQGNKFFFIAGTATEGTELWISDGTLGGTNIVKDIYPGTDDGVGLANSISYLYTSSNLYFTGTTANQGTELWKSDGSLGGTSLIQDIFSGTDGSQPELSFISNGGKILVSATDGDDPIKTDLYVLDAGSSSPTTYTFTGTGNWSDINNWANSSKPPATLPSGSAIVINNQPGGQCMLNATQHISTGASITIMTGSKLIIPGLLGTQ